MFIKTLTAAALALFASVAFANVDVNKADQAALESVKGIGTALSTKIINERKSQQFKDWPDLMDRIVGVGPKSAVRLSEAGLTVNGSAFGNNGAAATKTADSKAAKPAVMKTERSDAKTASAGK
jgi:competence protein ComEA